MPEDLNELLDKKSTDLEIRRYDTFMSKRIFRRHKTFVVILYTILSYRSVLQ